jgi:RNA polymerase sigma-70 factor (ECF subfamily)
MTAALSERPAGAAAALLDPATGTAGRSGDHAGDHADDRVLIDMLVARAVVGDDRARDQLLTVIHPLVLKYCRARLGRQESLMGSADDVAQDVCVAVVGALPHYRLKGLSFRAFVYGIAAHKVADAFRAIGRNRTDPVADLPDEPEPGDGPEHRLLARERADRLGALLAHLTPRQRQVLVLRLGVGLSAEETAQAVRSTPGTVRVTQHRALNRLRRIVLAGSAAGLPAGSVPAAGVGTVAGSTPDPAAFGPDPDGPAAGEPAAGGPDADEAVLAAVAALFRR